MKQHCVLITDSTGSFSIPAKRRGTKQELNDRKQFRLSHRNFFFALKINGQEGTRY